MLKEIFGESGALAIYDYLERCGSLRREEIPKKLHFFMKDLEELLGSGAAVVKKAVAENLGSIPGKQRQSNIQYLQ